MENLPATMPLSTLSSYHLLANPNVLTEDPLILLKMLKN